MGQWFALTLGRNAVGIPTQIQKALEDAEAALEAASVQDETVKGAQSQADEAQANLSKSQSDALDAHRNANQLASDFLTAARAYFGQTS